MLLCVCHSCEVCLGEFLQSVIQRPQKVEFQAMANILVVHSQSSGSENIVTGSLCSCFPGGIEFWSLGPIFLQCFNTVGWVIWPVKTRPRYDLQYVWWDVKPCCIYLSCFLVVVEIVWVESGGKWAQSDSVSTCWCEVRQLIIGVYVILQFHF